MAVDVVEVQLVLKGALVLLQVVLAELVLLRVALLVPVVVLLLDLRSHWSC